MRDRAKRHFPMLLATLLSIVQALALELLWSHASTATYQFEATLAALLPIAQVIATFFLIVLIWLVFASIMMRFQWVPDTMESVYPFIIGLAEFMLIRSLDAQNPGAWLLLMALLFAMMVRISHMIMRRARLEGDNQNFFSRFEPATIRDFRPAIIMTSTLTVLGIYVWWTNNYGVVAAGAVFGAIGFLVYQFYQQAKFWDRSVSIDRQDDAA